jgi:tetratricopeptide (TPR) repeat protein
VNPIVMAVCLLVIGLQLALILTMRARNAVERQFTMYSGAGRWEDALPFARALAARRSLFPEVRGRRQLNLGTVLMKLERWEEAQAAYESALATQKKANDPYASLTHLSVAALELHAGRADKAREHAKAVEEGPLEEVRPRARTIYAEALLLEGNFQAARDLLAPGLEALKVSKKPADMTQLAVLAAAFTKTNEPEKAAELIGIVRERLIYGNRKELAGQLPMLASVLSL